MQQRLYLNHVTIDNVKFIILTDLPFAELQDGMDYVLFPDTWGSTIHDVHALFSDENTLVLLECSPRKSL